MSLPWILLLLPLLVAALNYVLLQKQHTIAALLSTASAVATFGIAFSLLGTTSSPESYQWIKLGPLSLDIGITIDYASTDDPGNFGECHGDHEAPANARRSSSRSSKGWMTPEMS